MPCVELASNVSTESGSAKYLATNSSLYLCFILSVFPSRSFSCFRVSSATPLIQPLVKLLIFIQKTCARGPFSQVDFLEIQHAKNGGAIFPKDYVWLIEGMKPSIQPANS